MDYAFLFSECRLPKRCFEGLKHERERGMSFPESYTPEIIAVNNSADCPIHPFSPLKVFQLRKGGCKSEEKWSMNMFFGTLTKILLKFVFQAGTICLEVAFFSALVSMTHSVLRGHYAGQGRVRLCLSWCHIRWQEESYYKLLVPFLRKVHFLFFSLVGSLGVIGKTLPHKFLIV